MNRITFKRLKGVPHKAGFIAQVFKEKIYIGEIQSYNEFGLTYRFNAANSNLLKLMENIHSFKDALKYLENINN